MRRMYSQKQLEELISKMSGDILEVENIKQLNDEQCNNLKVGDIIAKKTGSQFHLYLVTYKQEKHGLCFSYFDASVVETQSYDYTNEHWVYNSEDKTALINVENAPTGDIQDVLGLDSVGKLVKGTVSGGVNFLRKTCKVVFTAGGTTSTYNFPCLVKEGITLPSTQIEIAQSLVNGDIISLPYVVGTKILKLVPSASTGSLTARWQEVHGSSYSAPASTNFTSIEWID